MAAIEGEWSSLPPMSTKRNGCAAAVVGDAVYVFGGSDGRNRLSSAEAYDVKSWRWSSLPPISTKRWGCAAAVVGDTVYVIGGYDGSNNSLSSAEAYDVKSRRWSSLPHMSTQRHGCATAVVGDAIYVIGGNDGSSNLSSAEAYDVKSRRWSSLPPMSTQRSWCAAAVVGDAVYVIGGYDGSNNLSSAEAYDVKSRRWSSLPPMSTRRSWCAAAVVGDAICVIGGWDGSNNLSSAEAYDVKSRRWSALPPMSTQRGGSAAAVVGDAICVIGGWDGSDCLSSAEAFAVRGGASAFYEKLIEADDRNINCKIVELIPLVEGVHEVKFLYTLVNACYRLGYLDQTERAGYVGAALEKAKTATTSTDAVAAFKLTLRKAEEDGLIDPHTKEKLDREAEVTHTSRAPFVKDLRRHIEANTARIEGLEGRVGRLETRVGSLESRTERLEACTRDLHASLVKLQKGIRRQRKVEAAVGVMSAVLNAVSFGVAGSAAAGAMSVAIGNIVDFGDLAHIQAVIKTMNDVTVSEAVDCGLQAIEDELADKRLYQAAEEGLGILQGTLHTQLIEAAKDDNPLVAIAVTAHVIGASCEGSSASSAEEQSEQSFLPAPSQKRNLRVIDRLQVLEDQLGLVEVPTAVLSRLKNLEENFFGETKEGTGSLIDRISELEKELGLH